LQNTVISVFSSRKNQNFPAGLGIFSRDNFQLIENLAVYSWHNKDLRGNGEKFFNVAIIPTFSAQKGKLFLLSKTILL